MADQDSTVNTLIEFIDQEQYKKDITFSNNNLDDAFVSQAALYAHYATLAQKAQYQADRCKQAIEILAAKLDLKIREEWDTASLGKITERAISARIETNKIYIQAQRRHYKAKMIAGLCKEAAEAFKHRKDMLQQVGAAHREERKGQLRMMEHDDAVRQRDNLKARALEVVRTNQSS